MEIDPPKEDKNCRSPAGSPVNAATGRNDQTVTDWSGPPPAAPNSSTTATGSRLELRRYYSSHFVGLATPAQSRLGNGWRTGFDAVAIWIGALASARHIHIMLPDFTEITYALEQGVWRPKDSYEWIRSRTDVTATLTVSAGTVTLRQADGTRYLFNDRGQLRQIVAPDGYTQTLTYQGNLHTRVADNRGGWIDFTYVPEGSAGSGLLWNARTSDGRRIFYLYEDRSQAGRAVKDRMTSGTNQWALESVVYPRRGGDHWPRTDYDYLDNAYRPYLITNVLNQPSKNRSTHTRTTWTYDVKKRVTSAEWTNVVRERPTSAEPRPSDQRWQYAYDDERSQVTVTDPSGTVTTYSRTVGADGVWRLEPLDRSSLPAAQPFSSPSNAGERCWFFGFICFPPPMCRGDVIRKCFLEGEFPSPDGIYVCIYRCNSGTREVRQVGRCARQIDDSWPM